jgi:hypothetical protein
MRLYAFCTLNPEKMIPCILVLERNIGTYFSNTTGESNFVVPKF